MTTIFGYQETLEVNGIVFRRYNQRFPNNLWNAWYVSGSLRLIEEHTAIFATLQVGQRGKEYAWTAQLFFGSHCLFVDSLEYDEAEDAVERVMARLENRDGRDIDETEHAREIIEAQGRQRKR